MHGSWGAHRGLWHAVDNCADVAVFKRVQQVVAVMVAPLKAHAKDTPRNPDENRSLSVFRQPDGHIILLPQLAQTLPGVRREGPQRTKPCVPVLTSSATRLLPHPSSRLAHLRLAAVKACATTLRTARQ